MGFQISNTKRKRDGMMLALNISKSTVQMQNDKGGIVDIPMPIDNFR